MLQQSKLEGSNHPQRVKHSFTQSIKGTPEQVFPLFCPVREADWIPGWTVAEPTFSMQVTVDAPPQQSLLEQPWPNPAHSGFCLCSDLYHGTPHLAETGQGSE